MTELNRQIDKIQKHEPNILINNVLTSTYFRSSQLNLDQ
jgi:hypothetical protein